MITFTTLLRYGTVSLISTAVSMTLLGLLVYTPTLPAAGAHAVATAGGTVPSFELNRRWVWGKSGRRSLLTEVAPFATPSLAGLLLSTAAVSVAAGYAARLADGLRTLVVEAVNVSAFGSLWVAQYLIFDRALFVRRPPARLRHA